MVGYCGLTFAIGSRLVFLDIVCRHSHTRASLWTVLLRGTHVDLSGKLSEEAISHLPLPRGRAGDAGPPCPGPSVCLLSVTLVPGCHSFLLTPGRASSSSGWVVFTAPDKGEFLCLSPPDRLRLWRGLFFTDTTRHLRRILFLFLLREESSAPLAEPSAFSLTLHLPD